MTLPKGYKAHSGKDMPVDPETLVDCIIRTADGLGHSGVTRARYHEWDPALHEKGIGAVVGYRVASAYEPMPHDKLHKRWKEKPPAKRKAKKSA